MADIPNSLRIDDRTTIVMGPASQTKPASAPSIHYLVVAEGPEHGRILELGPDPLTIGRAPPSDVVLHDVELSRVHCRVQLQRDQVLVTDLGSTNGTFIDGSRLVGPSTLSHGCALRIGRHVLKYERGSQSELAQNRDFDRSLDAASRYIRSLLPAPISTGPIRTEWLLLPSKRLGGDALGYHRVGDDAFALYLLDVSGHGVDAAMLAVAVMNALRPMAFPDADFRQPSRILQRLNAMFQMETQGALYFTMWYGVFESSQRVLRFASAGHHPAYLLAESEDRTTALWTRNPPVGVRPDCAFGSETLHVPPRSMLYLFSDGVFEIDTVDGGRWQLEDFVPLLRRPRDAEMIAEPQRLYQAVQRVARRGPLEDDFTLLVAHLE